MVFAFQQSFTSNFWKKLTDLQTEAINLSSATFTSMLKNTLFSENQLLFTWMT